MQRLPRPPRLRTLLRSTLALLGGLLLASALAAPASADELRYAPTPFELQDTGEDLCTHFNTAGLAAWPSIADPGAGPTVDIVGEGWISHAPPETVCLSIVPHPRHIEFTGYAGDEPVGFHTEPFDRPDDGGPFGRFFYDFTFDSPDGAPIDYVTVAMCYTPIDVIGEEAVCDEPVVLEPNGTSPQEQL